MLLTAVLIPGGAWAAWNAHPVATGIDQANGVELADLDADGDLDLAVTAGGGSMVAWYRNDGSGVFSLADNLPASAWMHGVAAVDLAIVPDHDHGATEMAKEIPEEGADLGVLDVLG